MKLYIIKLDNVDYEEDSEILVSAENPEDALVVAEIKEDNKRWNNKYVSNVECIRCIGIYREDIKEIIMVNNRGA
jgi:hypothetical protein